MNKSKLFFAFLMHCTSVYTFGQFHTITQPTEHYNIERIPDYTITDPSPHLPEKTSQYIDRYLSVSFPMKQLIVNSPFGQRKDPFTGKKRSHNGLDLRASCDEVYAMLDGTVKKTGEDKRSGKYIIIQYGEFMVSYCHLSRIWVKCGKLVKPGEVVGITGNTGRSTGEHLHITCRRDNRYIDPSILIQFIKEVKENALKQLCNIE